MLNYNGKIAEGSAENIFMVRDGQIFTPPLTSGCLAGITRESVIQMIKSDGIEITERELERDDLYAADEIFMTGTAAEVKSVSQVDNVTISDGKMGNITKTLQKSFMDVAMGKDERFLHWLTYI